MSNAPVLVLSGIRKSFRQGGRELKVLGGADLTLAAGEMVALVGPSGSGKTTLLQITGLLDSPDSGGLSIGGQDCAKLSEARRDAVRRHSLGFVYQFHHLLPEFSALENVVLPQMIAGQARRAARQRAEELLAALGLAERVAHRPAELSGGEQQRVAIARALANKPKVLIADEPTGNLDPTTSDEVFGYLQKMVKAEGLAALVATHNLTLASRMDRVVRVEKGRLA